MIFFDFCHTINLFLHYYKIFTILHQSLVGDDLYGKQYIKNKMINHLVLTIYQLYTHISIVGK